jgi:hypothetical protein
MRNIPVVFLPGQLALQIDVLEQTPRLTDLQDEMEGSGRDFAVGSSR